jgi:hypothetical protein
MERESLSTEKKEKSRRFWRLLEKTILLRSVRIRGSRSPEQQQLLQ